MFLVFFFCLEIWSCWVFFSFFSFPSLPGVWTWADLGRCLAAFLFPVAPFSLAFLPPQFSFLVCPLGPQVTWGYSKNKLLLALALGCPLLFNRDKVVSVHSRERQCNGGIWESEELLLCRNMPCNSTIAAQTGRWAKDQVPRVSSETGTKVWGK